MTSTLGILAKQPIPGQVKTRLAAATSPEWAAAVARACLLDTLDRLRTFPARRVIGYAPASARAYFQEIASADFALEVQADGDLGHRMATFLAQAFAADAERIVLIGTDSPTLPSEFIHQAFALLDHCDLVLGPCTDGGYYLLACTPPVPAIFDGIPWSTSQVLEQTLHRLRLHPRHLALLPPWYDVDTLDDWQCLQGHLRGLRLTGRDQGWERLASLLPEPNAHQCG